VDPTLVIVVAFCLGVGLWLIFFGVVVYHGWLMGSHPWAVRTRRRLFWHGIGAGMPYAWLLPGAIPMGLGLVAWGVSAWLMSANPGDGVATALALLGFPLIFIPMLLSWLRARWFLAPWHRSEVEREAAGFEPLLPVPAEGRQMTITRRELSFGLVLAIACLVVWWVAESVPFLIGALSVLGLMGTMRLIDR
jgi:hypothetical protein